MQRAISQRYRITPEEADTMDVETQRLAAESILGLFDYHIKLMYERDEIDESVYKGLLQALENDYDFINDAFDVNLASQEGMAQMRFGAIRHALSLTAIDSASARCRAELSQPSTVAEESFMLQNFSSIRNIIIDLHESGDIDELKAKALLFFFEHGQESKKNNQLLHEYSTKVIKSKLKILSSTFDAKSHTAGLSVTKGIEYMRLLVNESVINTTIDAIVQNEQDGFQLASEIREVVQRRVGVTLAYMFADSLDIDSRILPKPTLQASRVPNEPEQYANESSEVG